PEPLPAEVLRRHGIRADKRLGQHFLLDPGILRRVAAAALPLAGRTVLEVGPGPGGLTAALLAAGAGRVVAVERDRRFLPALAELAQRHPGRLEVVQADALAFDPAPLAAAGGPLLVVANLPYNVGTELLLGWLATLGLFERLVLMFQKEVALRLSAQPDTADWGRLAVLAQRLCRVERLFDLPPAAFAPPPRVSSSVVRLTPRDDRPEPEAQAALEAVTRAAFGQRRKMLRASLRTLVPEPDALLTAAGIDGTRRAETLAIPELERLAGIWRASRDRGG
ncbi:MAG TPA: 16S rRNA (adenine(1518)-N(6)/adenine(1519)-N(6))-dimethyltransferase RsmA, partial [Geminicoccaceae bacterium]